MTERERESERKEKGEQNDGDGQAKKERKKCIALCSFFFSSLSSQEISWEAPRSTYLPIPAKDELTTDRSAYRGWRIDGAFHQKKCRRRPSRCRDRRCQPFLSFAVLHTRQPLLPSSRESDRHKTRGQRRAVRAAATASRREESSKEEEEEGKKWKVSFFFNEVRFTSLLFLSLSLNLPPTPTIESINAKNDIILHQK